MGRMLGCWEYPSKITSYADGHVGLANRMNSIYTCYRLCKDVDVFWEKGKKNIFDYGSPTFYFPDVKEVSSLKGQYRKSWRLGLRKGEVSEGFSNKQRVFKKLWGINQLEPSDGASIDFEYERIPDNIREDYCRVIKDLRISDMFLELQDSYTSKNFGDGCVGVHMRTFKDSPEHMRRNWCGVDRYVSLMEKHKESKFYVATDDMRLISKLQNHFGSSRILYRECVDNKVDTFLDMLILAKCSKLILSPSSTFSQLAWFLGEAKAPVEVPYKQPDWLVY